MTTPTKEQIEQVFNNVFTWVEHKTIRVNFLELIEKIITEWEKIKDLDARVEKMCKNNPGIKDFEDFNEAINSPK